jgi:hypothetical protein
MATRSTDSATAGRVMVKIKQANKMAAKRRANTMSNLE